MSVSATSSAASAAQTDVDRTMLVLKKQQDVQKQQAAALVQLVQQAATDGTGRIIDARA